MWGTSGSGARGQLGGARLAQARGGRVHHEPQRGQQGARGRPARSVQFSTGVDTRLALLAWRSRCT